MMQRRDIRIRAGEARTHDLLCALASRDVRADLHHRWCEEYGDHKVAYGDDHDRMMIEEIASRLEERIDR